MPQKFRDVIDTQVDVYEKGRTIKHVEEIPDTKEIPIDDPGAWLKLKDLICVFVDMKGSTQLSAVKHDASTAGAYQLFTGTAVRLFSAFECPYIDVRGDGVFGLFNRSQSYRALAAAVTFKTFAREVFAPKLQKNTNIAIGAHIGIDRKTVLVRKVGLKRYDGRSDRQNEVWAGKPVNMASKLAAMGDVDKLLVSDRYYETIPDEHARKSCGCPRGTKEDLWSKIDLSQDGKFDFSTAYRLDSVWCSMHGRAFCETLLGLGK
jgi:class 3 adenylate cyclase